MRVLLVLMLVAGCDRVFGHGDPPIADAAADAVPDAVTDAALADHDEDGDTIDDALDVCPGTFDDQADQDGDGVGDACDPHPTLAIDMIAYFSSFQSFEGWSLRAGTWVPEADAVRVTTEVGSQLALLVDQGPFLAPTVTATIDDIASSSTFYGYGVALVTDPGGQALQAPGLECYQIRRNSAEELEVFDTRSLVAAKVTFGAFTAPIQVAMQADSGDGTGPPLCRARPTTGAANAVAPQDTTPIASAHVGLYTYIAKARFRSVTVIARRPAR